MVPCTFNCTTYCHMLVQNGSESLSASGLQTFLEVGTYDTKRKPVWLDCLAHAAMHVGSLTLPLAVLAVGQVDCGVWWGAFEPAWIWRVNITSSIKLEGVKLKIYQWQRPFLSWDVMLHILPVGCQCCRTTYWPNLQGSSIPCRMLIFEDGTDTLSWNFSNRLPAYATWHARRAKALIRPMHKPEIFISDTMEDKKASKLLSSHMAMRMLRDAYAMHFSSVWSKLSEWKRLTLRCQTGMLYSVVTF